MVDGVQATFLGLYFAQSIRISSMTECARAYVYAPNRFHRMVSRETAYNSVHSATLSQPVPGVLMPGLRLSEWSSSAVERSDTSAHKFQGDSVPLIMQPFSGDDAAATGDGDDRPVQH